jgi:hypothetical protein
MVPLLPLKWEPLDPPWSLILPVSPTDTPNLVSPESLGFTAAILLPEPLPKATLLQGKVMLKRQCKAKGQLATFTSIPPILVKVRVNVTAKLFKAKLKGKSFPVVTPIPLPITA